jgi:NTE family protein
MSGIGGATTRGLVLGGGGSSGNAWSIGVIAGLLDAGLDATEADLIVGTSAGATTAAQVTAASPTDLLEAIVSTELPRIETPSSIGGPDSARPVSHHLERTSRIIAAAEDPADMRRRLGAAALELDATSDASAQARWRATVASRLPNEQWPRQRLLITAVDAHTGEPVVFDNHGDVALVDAVAASCSSAFAYAIGDRRYIDGGYRTNADNADLAAGCARVLVLSPFGGRSRTPVEWGLHLAAQVDELRARGSSVAALSPDSDVEHLFGANAMDQSLRPAVARSGYDHGRALAHRLTDLWG